LIKGIRSTDKGNQLILVASGCQRQGVQTAEEAKKYLEAGANAFQLYGNLFTQGPFAVKEIEQDLIKLFK